MAVDMLHAEGLVDMVDLPGDELVGDLEQVDVVGLHQRVDLAEGEELVAAVEAEHREHRLRPEDPAARQIPVPQAAAAAVERGVDAAAHGVVDEVALAGAGRLPVEGEAEDQDDEAGGRRQRHRERGVRAPDRLVALLDHGDEARQRLDLPRGHHRGVAVRQRHVGDVAVARRRREQLRRGDRIEQAVVAEGSRSIGMRARMRRSTPAEVTMTWRPEAVPQDGIEVGQQRRQVLDVLEPLLPRRGQAIDPLGEQVGQRRDVVAEHLPLLARLIDDLHERAEADRDQERDDRASARRGAAPAPRSGADDRQVSRSIAPIP